MIPFWFEKKVILDCRVGHYSLCDRHMPGAVLRVLQEGSCLSVATGLQRPFIFFCYYEKHIKQQGSNFSSSFVGSPSASSPTQREVAVSAWAKRLGSWPCHFLGVCVWTSLSVFWKLIYKMRIIILALQGWEAQKQICEGKEHACFALHPLLNARPPGSGAYIIDDQRMLLE